MNEPKLDNSIDQLVAGARSVITDLINRETLGKLGITCAQAGVLLLLMESTYHDDRSVTALASRYGNDPSAMTRLLERLKRRGLLSQARCYDDRRVVIVTLTDEGSQIASQLPAIYTRAHNIALIGFSREEVGFLKSMLRRIVTPREHTDRYQRNEKGLGDVGHRRS
ncbi:MarR family winged helix-turn-helix transcriptional regulator [Caballeronia sp. KNU42]